MHIGALEWDGRIQSADKEPTEKESPWIEFSSS